MRGMMDVAENFIVVGLWPVKEGNKNIDGEGGLKVVELPGPEKALLCLLTYRCVVLSS
jgi:hypothetical protein